MQDTVNNRLNTISNEGQVLSAVYTKLQDVATTLPIMSVADAIKKIAAILDEKRCSPLYKLSWAHSWVRSPPWPTRPTINLLDTCIYISVICDIVAAIGVPSISFLGPFSWIAAVSVGVVYNIVYVAAPFHDSSNVNALVSASSWEDMSRLFGRVADVNAASQPKAAEALALPHELANDEGRR